MGPRQQPRLRYEYTYDEQGRTKSRRLIETRPGLDPEIVFQEATNSGFQPGYTGPREEPEKMDPLWRAQLNRSATDGPPEPALKQEAPIVEKGKGSSI